MNSPNLCGGGPALLQLQRVSIERGSLILSTTNTHRLRNHLQALYGFIELEDKARALQEWRELKKLVEGE